MEIHILNIQVIQAFRELLQMLIFLIGYLFSSAAVLSCSYENVDGTAGTFDTGSIQTACNVTFPCWVGDGWCDDTQPGYNTPECGFDGGDCCEDTCISSNKFHVYECGANGYSCKVNSFQPSLEPTTCRRTTPPSTSPMLPTTTNAPDQPNMTTPSPTISSTQSTRTESPSIVDSRVPTIVPWRRPSCAPSTTDPATVPPAKSSNHPSTLRTEQPRQPSTEPTTSSTARITAVASALVPTAKPTTSSTAAPTRAVTSAPTADCQFMPTIGPTVRPTHIVTQISTTIPTVMLTTKPTVISSLAPTTAPTIDATSAPTAEELEPTAAPTCVPTAEATSKLTCAATSGPTSLLTEVPTLMSTSAPTTKPSAQPTFYATSMPTDKLSEVPTAVPAAVPTMRPTAKPTCTATFAPTSLRTAGPTVAATAAPTTRPTVQPTCEVTSPPTVKLTADPSLVPTAMPATRPTAYPTCSPTAVPTAQPVARLTTEPTLRPTPRLTSPPISRSPAYAPTQKPSSAPSVAPSTGEPTQQPSASLLQTRRPTAHSTRLPTTQASRTPTASTSPTSTTTATATAAPSVQLVYTASLSFSFLMVNTTLPLLPARWSANETSALARGPGAVLLPFGFVDSTKFTEAHRPLQFPVSSMDYRRLQSGLDRQIVWNATVRVLFNTTAELHQPRSSAIYMALNGSLYSGQLQQSVRAASREPPIAENLFEVCLCATTSAELCLVSIAPAPQSRAAQIPCDRNTGMWEQLYNAPTKLPWYLVWLFALGVAWLVLTVRATAQGLQVLSGEPTLVASVVLSPVCGVLRLGNIALLVIEYWGDTRSNRANSLACSEFAFLDQLAEWNPLEGTFYNIHLMILLRDIFYPSLVILCCSWMRSQVWRQQRRLDSLGRPNNPGVVRTFLANTCFFIGIAAVVLGILLVQGITALLKTSVVANSDQWKPYLSQATQLVSGILLLFIAMRFAVSMRAIRRLIEAYIQRAGVREEEDVLSALEAEVFAVDDVLSPRQRSGDLGRCDGGLISGEAVPDEMLHRRPQYQQDTPSVLRPGERSIDQGQFTMNVALCVVNALLMSVTASAVILSTPLSALLLYSVGARVFEMLLVGAILCNARRVDVPPVHDRRDLSSSSLRAASAAADAGMPGESSVDEEGSRALQLQTNKLAIGRDKGFTGSSFQERERPIVSTNLPEKHADCDQRRTVQAYKKTWPWVFTPSGDVPAKHNESDSVSVDNSTVPVGSELASRYAKCSNDSPGDDSTDSGLQYFA